MNSTTQTEDKRILSTIVLGISRLDCILHDGTDVINPVFSVFNLFCASNIQFHVLRNAAVYQTQSFRQQKRIDGTEQQEIWQSLVRRRVVQEDANLEFITMNGVFAACVLAEIKDNRVSVTVPPYVLHYKFVSVDFCEIRGQLSKSFHGCTLENVEAI